jgi:glycerol-3-phosphate dehydrogenase (NAD(P)+)
LSRPAAQIAVLGTGSWGTSLAVHLCRNGHRVRLWGHDREEVADLRRDGENKRYLPGVRLPAELVLTTDLKPAIQGADGCLVVVPSHAFGQVVDRLQGLIDPKVGLAWATKGLDPARGTLLHHCARHALPGVPLAVISGPSFAAEVARGLPTAVTVASDSPAHATRWSTLLHGKRFRAYTSPDIIGVQICGAAKNVLAIATGIADGLSFGANARAALITRGLAELTRLGTALGGRAETFMGLAGIGDLVLTCTDDQSRNRRMGLALAKGLDVESAKAQIGQEVEGVLTARAVARLALVHEIEMPISEQIHRVLYDRLPPLQAAANLLEREPKAELA